MTGGTETLHIVRQWVEKAEEDLINARHTLTREEAEEAVMLAERVRAEVRRHLPLV